MVCLDEWGEPSIRWYSALSLVPVFFAIQLCLLAPWGIEMSPAAGVCGIAGRGQAGGPGRGHLSLAGHPHHHDLKFLLLCSRACISRGSPDEENG